MNNIKPNGSVWHGDKTDGIEFRYQGGDLDEICVYVRGDCVLHAERLDDNCIWMGLYAANHTANVNLASKNGKAHVVFRGEEGWNL